MAEKTSYSRYKDNFVATEHYPQVIPKKRTNCVICKYEIDANDESIFSHFNCNVRAFQKETFKVWRCPKCKTIHSLDIVDIAPYYEKYPIADGVLTWEMRLCYGKLSRQLIKHGFSKANSILDYGCANGLFIEYLQQKGFSKCYGYDPYADKDGFGDDAILDAAPFDYILLQDVIEHVEEPTELLSKLNGLLAPGGYILIGTPNAANIDLTKPNISDFYNPVHVPYHFHIYTPQALKYLGNSQNWQAVEFCDRAYHDTPWMGVNTRAWNQYQKLCDGSLDTIHEPIELRKALTSYKMIFYVLFGYWLSYHTEMSMMFRKPNNIDNAEKVL
ncbi:MAG: class I SAM-dependent methyltransferase [Rivularia sp. (in: Bacteria)]|nr:class I SAM-dependent methyltransferase [Rivularia sp. MS3]